MIPAQFEQLRENERSFLRARPSWAAFPLSWLSFAVFLFLSYYLGDGFRSFLNWFGVSTGSARIGTLIPPVLIEITIVLRRYRWSFELDQQHVRVIKGYLSQSKRNIQLVAWVTLILSGAVLSGFGLVMKRVG